MDNGSVFCVAHLLEQRLWARLDQLLLKIITILFNKLLVFGAQVWLFAGDAAALPL